MDGFGASITDSSAQRPLTAEQGAARRRHAQPVRRRTSCRSCASRSAPPTSSTARTTPTTTSRPARPTTGSSTSRSPRPQADPAAAAPALRLNPQIKVIGSPWSPPAWMKTNQSLIGGRLIDSPRIYDAYARLLRQVRARLQARGRADLRADRAERAAEPHAQGLPGHGHAGRPAGQADRRARAEAAPRAAQDQDPRLRPQLVDAPGRHQDDAAGRGPRDRVPDEAAADEGGALDRRHRVPLLRG